MILLRNVDGRNLSFLEVENSNITKEGILKDAYDFFFGFQHDRNR